MSNRSLYLCFWMYNGKSRYVYALYKCFLRLDYSKKKKKKERKKKRKEKKSKSHQVWAIPIPISTTKDVICCSNGYIYHFLSCIIIIIIIIIIMARNRIQHGGQSCALQAILWTLNISTVQSFIWEMYKLHPYQANVVDSKNEHI